MAECRFNDAAWKEGEGAFGTMENEHVAKTQWGEEFIWVRRVADIQEDLTGKNVYLEYSHDDDVIIYINGIKVVDTGNACKKSRTGEVIGRSGSVPEKGRKPDCRLLSQSLERMACWILVCW